MLTGDGANPVSYTHLDVYKRQLLMSVVGGGSGVVDIDRGDDAHLFTGTVMENIPYGRLEATDEECIAAARLANADGFIKRLPEGYNTMLTGCLLYTSSARFSAMIRVLPAPAVRAAAPACVVTTLYPA